MIPILLSKSTPSSSSSAPSSSSSRPPPPIPALPQQSSSLPLSGTPPPPVPPARSILPSMSNKPTHQVLGHCDNQKQQQKNISSSIRSVGRSENYYITSSLISRVSSKDQLTSSDSVNNLARLGQAAKMRRCLSSTSPLSNASSCSNSSSSNTSTNDPHVQDVHADVHPVPDDDMINYTEISHDKDDKGLKKESFLSQSQTSLSGSSSFFMDDDNWYSELIMSRPIKLPSVMKSSDHCKFTDHKQCIYNHSNGNSTSISNNYMINKVKRSSTFNSADEDCDGMIDVRSTTPSPSDSGITDQLEGMLREKDSEIALLRETLEHNEQVGFYSRYD